MILVGNHPLDTILKSHLWHLSLVVACNIADMFFISFLSLPFIPTCRTQLSWIYYQLPSWFKHLTCAHYLLPSNFISTNRALKNQWIWNLPWKIWIFHLIQFCSDTSLQRMSNSKVISKLLLFFFLLVASKKRDTWYELCYQFRWFIHIMYICTQLYEHHSVVEDNK